MYECPQGFQAWLIEKQTLVAPPRDAACDYSLEPADAQLDRVETPPPAVTLADVEEAFGAPAKRAAAASAND